MQKVKSIIFSLIPQRYRQNIIEWKNRMFGTFRNYHYSQFGEDIVLRLVLKSQIGFYVDVGAYHPEKYSNTHLLYLKGWRGINVDPNPAAIRLFNKIRKRDINLCFGVSNESKEMKYFMFSEPALNTFSEKRARQLRNDSVGGGVKEEIIRVLPLREILLKHLPKGQKINLLNVDTEGLDLEVLQSNDWSLFRPDIIIVEDHEFDPENIYASSIYRFLKEKGYKLYYHLGPSLIFKSYTF